MGRQWTRDELVDNEVAKRVGGSVLWDDDAVVELAKAWGLQVIEPSPGRQEVVDHRGEHVGWAATVPSWTDEAL